jgi:hypothetical protein
MPITGGRRTHDYPFGKPFPLVLVNVAALVLGVLWVGFGFEDWSRTVGIILLFFALLFVNFKLHQAYERTGLAVQIARPLTVIKFDDGIPVPLLTLRWAFLVFVAVLVVSGVAPLRDATAKMGMIGSVIGLVFVGILHFGIERYYVHTGRGNEVPRANTAPESPNRR